MKVLLALALLLVVGTSAAEPIPIGDWRGESYTYSDVVQSGDFVEVTATSKTVSWRVLIACEERTFAFVSVAFAGGETVVVEPTTAIFYTLGGSTSLMSKLHKALCNAI